jgi:hypothetical protein
MLVISFADRKKKVKINGYRFYKSKLPTTLRVLPPLPSPPLLLGEYLKNAIYVIPESESFPVPDNAINHAERRKNHARRDYTRTICPNTICTSKSVVPVDITSLR